MWRLNRSNLGHFPGLQKSLNFLKNTWRVNSPTEFTSSGCCSPCVMLRLVVAVVQCRSPLECSLGPGWPRCPAEPGGSGCCCHQETLELCPPPELNSGANLLPLNFVWMSCVASRRDVVRVAQKK